MASVVGICNVALRKIGAQTITSLNQGIKNANYMNDVYAEKRDSLLSMHQWNFAVKRVKLAQSATVPVVKFDYQYALPSDFIRAIAVFDTDEGLGSVDHKIENGFVMSSASEIWLVYVACITDPNTMTALFREALSCYLAMEAAIGISESNSLHEIMRREFEKALRRARSADAMEDLPDRMPAGSWWTGRGGRWAEKSWSW